MTHDWKRGSSNKLCLGSLYCLMEEFPIQIPLALQLEPWACLAQHLGYAIRWSNIVILSESFCSYNLICWGGNLVSITDHPDAFCRCRYVYYAVGDMQDACLNIMFAGYDTSASALLLLMHLIKKHPEVEKQLRAEQDQVGYLLAITIKCRSYLMLIISTTFKHPPRCKLACH